VLYVYESLPPGTYHFRFRARTGTVGSFTEPPATAEMMYRQGVDAASAGSRLVIGP
jgi:alpha-2-macroglobulin